MFNDPMTEFEDMKRLLVALVAMNGLDWDGVVLSKGHPLPLPIVVDHRFDAHAAIEPEDDI